MPCPDKTPIAVDPGHAQALASRSVPPTSRPWRQPTMATVDAIMAELESSPPPVTGRSFGAHPELKGRGPHHLTTAAPQAKPAPKAASTTRSPGWIFPSALASASAIGMLAAVVFP